MNNFTITQGHCGTPEDAFADTLGYTDDSLKSTTPYNCKNLNLNLKIIGSKHSEVDNNTVNVTIFAGSFYYFSNK